MTKVQIIHDETGAPAFAVIPWEEYRRLSAGPEGDEDSALLARAETAARDDDRLPADIAERIMRGENTLKVLREWRDLTQDQLATAADTAKQYISQIETNRRGIGGDVAPRLAKALNVSIETLLT